MRIVITALMFLVIGLQGVSAQTFAPGFATDDAEQTTSPQKAVTAPVAKQNTANGNKTESENNDSVLVPATVNIGGEKPKEIYDNSMGHVIEYKSVNGKIIFGNPEDRKVLVYINDFKVEKSMSGIVRCSMRVYVLNDMTEPINNLSMKLIWPEISTSLQMRHVKPGIRTYRDIMLLGEGCFSMDKTPTVEINRCRVKGKSQEQCAEAVHWFRHR